MKKLLFSLIALSAIINADYYVKMSEQEFKEYASLVVQKKGFFQRVDAEEIKDKVALFKFSVDDETVVEVIEIFKDKNLEDLKVPLETLKK